MQAPTDTSDTNDAANTISINKADALANVFYDIRGPVLAEAHRLEEEGHRILKLNIGNPAPFGFEAPDEILRDVIHNLPSAQGYCDSKGLYSARKAIMQYCQQIGIEDVDVDDIYVGNGASELIVMALQGLLNTGDEILIPSPDFPLWTGATNLCRGNAVHYRCDEAQGWFPDMEDLAKKVSTRTRALVIINPNNPTGAVYSRAILEQLLEFARQHKLMVFSDEIYDKILYDDARHIPSASLAPDLLTLTFNGLSKAYRVAGFRTGWMVVSGARASASDYIEGIDILASMRLCSNVPTQHAIQTALGGYQSINALTEPGGRLYQQRETAYSLLTQIEGISCVKPRGALYLFPKLDNTKFNINDDEKFVFDLLKQENLLLVQGSAFNWPEPDHFRIVFLPHEEDLSDAISRMARFLETYRQ